MKKSLGLYIHIPFCIKKCNYCDFCSFSVSDRSRMSEYADELCRRMQAASPLCSEYRVDTVYFGGGTPTLMPISDIEKLLCRITQSFDVADNAEITAECNPASADLSYLTSLRALGVNRLSIGLQSVHDRELEVLGRSHLFGDFCSIYGDARRSGFDNISVDLMYGIPDQTLESFRESLDTVVELHPEHISAYGLKIERGTRFFEKRSSLSLPDEDTEYEMYLSCSEILGAGGYKKYEISNFSLEGRESRHNLRYWRGEDYLGFGVAAHSCFLGERFGNSRDLSAFLRGEDIVCERQTLTDQDRLNEYIMLSLRLCQGIDIQRLEALVGMPLHEFYPPLSELCRGGFMKIENGRLSFTDQGFFVSNSILSDMLRLD